ncbi:MAG: cellulase family glycosylhydrolase [Candidatus Aenigmatarchaeota archaeon]
MMMKNQKLTATLFIISVFIGAISLSLASLTQLVSIRSTGTILPVIIFDNCDHIGGWRTISTGTITVDSSDKVEGTASLKMNYSAGWDVLFYKDGSWDLSATPVIRFRFKPNNMLPVNFRFGISDDKNSYKYDISDQLMVGEWCTVSVDLRLPPSGVPDLTHVRRIEFSCWDQYVQAGSFNVDFMELLPGPPIPLTIEMSPYLTRLVLINGTSIKLKVFAVGGEPPYTYEWFVNTSKQAETQTFTYKSIQPGNCTIKVKVTDSKGEFKTMSANVSILKRYYLPKPRPLHTENGLICNDVGEPVYLRGVHLTNFGDSSTGWFLGSSLLVWNETVVEKNLDVLESWGCNFLYLSGIDFDRLVNNVRYSTSGAPNIGLMDAVKRVIELAYEHGIYVAIGIDNLVLQDTGNPQYVWYWAPNNLETWTNGWLNISRELREYSNVLYGMNAEPALSESEMKAYFNAIVQAVLAIRDYGDEHIFFYHEDYCSFPVRFDKPATQGGEMIRKLHEYNVTNIVYSGHIYRWHGTFGGTPDYFNPETARGSNSDGVYTYEDIVEALTYYGYKKILEEYKVPIIMGEGGPAKASAISSPNTWEKEITCYKNLLQVLNDWGIGYACFWWRQPGTEGPVFSPLVLSGQTDFIPNEWGQVLIQAARA